MQVTEDSSNEAKEELKRADHSIFVTLKYTRTVDVIHNIIKRLIGAFDASILDYLSFLLDNKKIKDISKIAMVRAEDFLKLQPSAKEFIDFYFLLRKIDRSPFGKREEYRKNVTMISKLSAKEIINIDVVTLKKYYMNTIHFTETIEKLRE